MAMATANMMMAGTGTTPQMRSPMPSKAGSAPPSP